jgi:HEAT repeat protein
VDREQGTDEAVYAFFHPTFQEFFAACGVDNWDFFLPRNHVDHPVDGKVYRIFEEKWKEVIALWLGFPENQILTQEKETFIQALIEFEECNFNDFYEFRAYFLAAEGVAEFNNSKQADSIIEQIVHWGFGNFDEEKKLWQEYLEPISESARAVLLKINRDKKLIKYLLQKFKDLLKNNERESLLGQLLKILSEVGKGNQEVINTLQESLKIITSKGICLLVSDSLGQMDPCNEIAISILTQLINNEDEWIRGSGTESLRKIDPQNELIIKTLIELIQFTKTRENSFYEWVRMQAVENLLEMKLDNQGLVKNLNQLRVHLVENLQPTHDENLRWQAAKILEKIDSKNKQAISAMMEIFQSTQNKNLSCQIAAILVKIDPNNEKLIQFLSKITQSIEGQNISWQEIILLRNPFIFDIFKSIDPNNEKVIAILIQLLQRGKSGHSRWEAARTLKTIVQKEQMPNVITTLKKHLSNENCKRDFERYKNCHEVVWKCAQTLSYLDFYRAWYDEQ